MEKGNWKIAVEAIESHKNIFIFHHIRPDGDCLGSQFGLAEFIKTNYPDKNVFVLGDAIGSFPFMNFKHDKFEEIDKKYLENSLGVVVDANNSNRIQFSEYLVQKKFTKTLRIDHHPETPDIDYDYTWENEDYIASGEQVAYIAMNAKWKVTDQAARYTYLAIYTDSGRFQYDAVSKRTFEVMTYLHKAPNFRVWDINLPMSYRDEKKVRFSAYVLLNYKKLGKVLYFHVTKKIQKKFKLDSNQANDVGILSNIGDCKIWLFFIDLPDGSIRVRVRSNSITINEICRKYAPGGGHAFASGATVHNKKEMMKLVKELQEEVIKYESNN
ncbi:DHH family phosphoesterase [Metamycoplasma hyosynoviae]|uniref:Bifunctional oligoribonuclease/PAP phosphatase NrnA n=1 Tax=Metamycoplasma hyosynoviae TaxID=29559 RepID=A0A063YEN7_9BACT|nr:bifunctional oligoribonuclease/PAP phosphatase NrnA [Metamycoplasma hyosynoviae]KDE41494.1 phosphoesterase [Metamycoplasma hyosynoviae]KDE42757.1 phosphoesterase [Metamycoplasma hyosynoviae]KDE43029.1 phosphoesterase [Metamycoplasma hyosynoviae]KDE43173.1 phosphoesterase [Metamycoplasma hyosynoviae]KDE44749.1 phosphoesterase [Metamycoplasma hyosynoviae]